MKKLLKKLTKIISEYVLDGAPGEPLTTAECCAYLLYHESL